MCLLRWIRDVIFDKATMQTRQHCVRRAGSCVRKRSTLQRGYGDAAYKITCRCYSIALSIIPVDAGYFTCAKYFRNLKLPQFMLLGPIAGRGPFSTPPVPLLHPAEVSNAVPDA